MAWQCSSVELCGFKYGVEPVCLQVFWIYYLRVRLCGGRFGIYWDFFLTPTRSVYCLCGKGFGRFY